MKAFDLLAGSTEYYVDAVYYDDEYKKRTADVKFYTERYLQAGEKVLELGVGSGRIALKAVRKGASVLGLDLSPTMLKRAEEQRQKLPKSRKDQVEFQQGDMRSFDLGRRFKLVSCPFNAFQHLYSRDDIDRCLTCVRQHLVPDGKFVFDVLLPDFEYLTRSPFKTYAGVRFKHATYGVHYVYSERSAYDPITQVNQMWFIMDRDEAPLPEHPDAPAHIETQLSHRCFFPAELEALLWHNGFEIEELYGDFEGNPLENDSESQVMVCRLR